MDNQKGLLKAAESGNRAEVQRLVDAGGVDLNPPAGAVYDHPLLLASWNGHVDIVRSLLDRGADVNQVDNNGGTAVFWAAINNHADVALLLLQRYAHVNIQDKHGWTALHNAAYNGHVDVIRVLLDHGADRSLKEKYGQTAEGFARGEQKLAAAALLRDFVPVPVPRASDINSSSLAPQQSPAAPVAPPIITGQTDELASLRARLQATTDELAAARAQHVTLRQEIDAANEQHARELRTANDATRRAEAEAAMVVRLADQRTTELRACEAQLAVVTAQKQTADTHIEELEAAREADRHVMLQVRVDFEGQLAAVRSEMERRLAEQLSEAASVREGWEQSNLALIAARADIETQRQRAMTAEQQRNRATHDLHAADSTIRELESGFHSAYRLLGSFLHDAVPIMVRNDVVIDRTTAALGHGSNAWVWDATWNGMNVVAKTDFQSLALAQSPVQRQHAAIGLIRECHALHKRNGWTPYAARLHGLVIDQETGLPTAIILEKLLPLPATSEGLSAHQLARLGSHVTAALVEMHERRPAILHRDIKPENILRTEDNVYKVTDLSEAKLVRHHSTRWSAVGTRSFGAPEIGDGTQQTGAVDIYSLGMTITEIFLKVKLNCPENASTAQRQAYNESRVALVTGMDERLGGFLSRMVALASELRPTARECHEFFTALEEAERARDGVER